jgi:hypothetical protein
MPLLGVVNLVHLVHTCQQLEELVFHAILENINPTLGGHLVNGAQHAQMDIMNFPIKGVGQHLTENVVHVQLEHTIMV